MSVEPQNSSSESIQDAASGWLARGDRGLGAAEQDAYLEWLYRNPLHGRAIVQLERVWASLNKLEQWRPAHSAIPNPDLLAPRWPSRTYWLSTALAAAAAIAMGFYVWLPSHAGSAAPHREAIIHPGPERQTLADGSVVELNQGAKIDVQFTPAERRVQLLSGEVHFAAAKNSDRPFIVQTGKVAVRAVGTAFTVALGAQQVSVLVTEGKVRVDETSPDAAAPPREISLLSSGQRAVINTAALETLAAQVSDMTPAEVERALSWQGLRLEFIDMRLGDVATAFNRYNRLKLVVADEASAGIVVGGNFRADNVEAFVRLLAASFGVTAFRHGDEIVLRKTR